MEIGFRRSGGFAGAATAIEGKITFEGGVGRVRSGSGYRRDLTPEETRALRAAIDQFPPSQPTVPGQQRDAYQYDLWVQWDDGRTQHLVAHDDSSVGSANLLDWVRQECDRIWQQRTSSHT
jgi:hypothetical protein